MNILLIGSGGREHSLALALSQSSHLATLYIAPGNPGTATCGTNIPIADNDITGLLEFAKANNIGLTFVGPEAPLVAGIVDLFQSHGLTIVGPDQNAARLEGSKVWSKSFMQRHNIPTAAYATFNDYAKAKAYLQEQNTYPIVIKADGLAAGKGVTVAQIEAEAFKALEECFLDKRFGAAGAEVVIEAFLKGEEASILAFTDGKTVIPMLAAQDHKAVYDNDQGPNTGGMGAYCPAPIITADMGPIIQQTILDPIIAGMAAEGMSYKGILYAGIMVTAEGPYVVEYNVRFGDPETQVVLPLLKTDLIDIFVAIAETRLASLPIEWHDGSCICVVMASGGYPGAMETGFPITGIAEAEISGISVIQAGTKIQDGQLVSSGGRILGIVSRDANLKKAIDTAYAHISKVQFKNVHYRHDIGKKALPNNV